MHVAGGHGITARPSTTASIAASMSALQASGTWPSTMSAPPRVSAPEDGVPCLPDLEDEAPLTPLLVERVRGETQVFVKEVKVGAARYVLCRNEAEAERERNERQAIIAGLAKQLARGDKALIVNSTYRRYLRRTPSASGKPGPAFEIDPGKAGRGGSL